MKRGIITALAVGAGLTAGMVTPAAAAYYDCPDRAVCMWDDANYGGELSWRQPGFGLWNISWQNNDDLTSWANRSYTRAAAYEHANGAGACLNLVPRSSSGWVGRWWNDRISSWKTNGSC